MVTNKSINSYQLLNKFILRTPILPIESLEKFIYSENDLISFCFSNPLILEGIFLSSPELLTEFYNIKNKSIKSKKKLLHAVLKYLIRMSTKPVPNGLHSKSSIGKLSSTKNKILNLSNELKRNYQLDTYIYFSILNYLLDIPCFVESLIVYPNNTIYSTNDEYSYYTYDVNETDLNFKIGRVEKNEIIENLLILAKNGIIVGDLYVSLRTEFTNIINPYALISELLKNKFLISQLELTLNNSNFLNSCINIIENIRNKPDYLDNVNSALKKVNVILNSFRTNSELATYKEIADALSFIPVNFSKARFLYVNATCDLIESDLNKEIASELTKLIEFVPYLIRNSHSLILNNFKKEFVTRFQDQELPLSHVLDPVFGIGYVLYGESNQSEDISLSSINQNSENLTYFHEFNKLDLLLNNLIISSTANNSYEVELPLFEVEKLFKPAMKISKTISALIKIIVTNNNESNYMVHLKDFTSFATRSMSRFSIFNQEISEFCKEIDEIEFDPNSKIINAEVIHIPNLRIANILQRNVYNKFIIPLITNCDNKQSYEVTYNDLFVSVRNNRIVIKSKSLNKEIIPCASTVYNFSKSESPIYKFLCELQYQNVIPGWEFNWGVFGNNLKFTPRLKWKNIILSRATWRFTYTDFNFLLVPNCSFNMQEFHEFQVKYKLPNTVYAKMPEGELFLNLKSYICIELLQKEVSKLNEGEFIVFYEDLNQLGKSNVQSIMGNFENEYLFSYANYNSTSKMYYNSYSNCKNVNEKTIKNVQRKFPPGSEWTFYSIYCNEQFSDKLLLLFKSFFIRETKIFLKVEKWFFIRYNDPCYHLRFRFLINDKFVLESFKNTFSQFLNECFIKKVIWNVQIGTYERELERYGYQNIEAAEFLFTFDSKAILSIINEQFIGLSLNDKILIGILSVDFLFRDFNLSLEKCIDFTNKFILFSDKSTNFMNEYQKNYYLANKDKIFNLMDVNQVNFIINPQILTVFHLRSNENKKTLINILENCSLEDIEFYIESYIHMNLNRLFSSGQRNIEYLIYYLLNKYYSKKINRIKYTKNKHD